MKSLATQRIALFILGISAVGLLSTAFRSAFSEVSFSVSDLQVEEKRLSLQWKCQGPLIGSLWGHNDPNGNVILLEGSLALSCVFVSSPDAIYGTLAKLTCAHFNWNPSTFHRVFALPEDQEVDLRNSVPLQYDLLETE